MEDDSNVSEVDNDVPAEEQEQPGFFQSSTFLNIILPLLILGVPFIIALILGYLGIIKP
jgi:hypothetical protein